MPIETTSVLFSFLIQVLSSENSSMFFPFLELFPLSFTFSYFLLTFLKPAFALLTPTRVFVFNHYPFGWMSVFWL